MVEIRDFETRDIAAANAITNGYIERTAIHFAFAPASDAEFEAAWRAAPDRYPWLTAEVNGRLVGYAKAAPWRSRDAYAGTCETGVYLDPAHTGQRLGTALYDVLLPRLRLAGFHVVVAGMTLPNAPSRRLHEKLGFEPVGVFRQVGRKHDAWHDVGFWQLVFDA